MGRATAADLLLGRLFGSEILEWVTFVLNGWNLLSYF